MVTRGAALWRWLFWFCVIAGVALALTPATEHEKPWFPQSDKLQHAASFAILVGLGWLGRFRSMWRLALGLVLLGAVIEVLQSFTSTRTAECGDLLADMLGVCVGLAVAAAVERRSGRLPEKDRR